MKWFFKFSILNSLFSIHYYNKFQSQIIDFPCNLKKKQDCAFSKRYSLCEYWVLWVRDGFYLHLLPWKMLGFLHFQYFSGPVPLWNEWIILFLQQLFFHHVKIPCEIPYYKYNVSYVIQFFFLFKFFNFFFF